jgi:hypothetical protein
MSVVRWQRLLALPIAFALGGCGGLGSVDAMWNVWFFNESSQVFTVEVKEDNAFVQAYRLGAGLANAVGGRGYGADAVVRLYRPGCQLALTLAGKDGPSVSIHRSGQVTTFPWGAWPSDAPQIDWDDTGMVLSAGCSEEWRGDNPSFSAPLPPVASPSA